MPQSLNLRTLLVGYDNYFALVRFCKVGKLSWCPAFSGFVTQHSWWHFLTLWAFFHRSVYWIHLFECVREGTKTSSPHSCSLWRLGRLFPQGHGYRSFKRNTGEFVGCEKKHKRYATKCHCKKDTRLVRQQLRSLGFYWNIRKIPSVMKSSVGSPFHSRPPPCSVQSSLSTFSVGIYLF